MSLARVLHQVTVVLMSAILANVVKPVSQMKHFAATALAVALAYALMAPAPSRTSSAFLIVL